LKIRKSVLLRATLDLLGRGRYERTGDVTMLLSLADTRWTPTGDTLILYGARWLHCFSQGSVNSLLKWLDTKGVGIVKATLDNRRTHVSTSLGFVGRNGKRHAGRMFANRSAPSPLQFLTTHVLALSRNNLIRLEFALADK